MSDDDVRLPRQWLARMLRVMTSWRLDIAQPSHGFRSEFTHDITRRHRASQARLTTFVEIGPVFVVAPGNMHRFLPFPDDLGMGWGLEATWAALTGSGCRLGIVDAVPMRHLVKPGVDYDMQFEMRQLTEKLALVGAQHISEIQRVIATWPMWSRKPPAA